MELRQDIDMNQVQSKIDLIKEVREGFRKLDEQNKKHAPKELKWKVTLLCVIYNIPQSHIARMTHRTEGIISTWISKYKKEQIPFLESDQNKLQIQFEDMSEEKDIIGLHFQNKDHMDLNLRKEQLQFEFEVQNENKGTFNLKKPNLQIENEDYIDLNLRENRLQFENELKFNSNGEGGKGEIEEKAEKIQNEKDFNLKRDDLQFENELKFKTDKNETKEAYQIEDNRTLRSLTFIQKIILNLSKYVYSNLYKVPFIFVGMLSFLYLLNGELNFYLESDLEQISLFDMEHQGYRISLCKSILVLGGIVLFSLLGKKVQGFFKKGVVYFFLFLFSIYSLAIVSCSSYLLLTEKKSQQYKNQSKAIENRLRSEFPILVDKKERLLKKLDFLQKNIEVNEDNIKNCLQDLAYGNAKVYQRKVDSLIVQKDRVEEKYDVVLSQIIEKKSKIAKEDKITRTDQNKGVLFSFFCTILIRFFAMVIKITCFSVITNRKENSEKKESKNFLNCLVMVLSFSLKNRIVKWMEKQGISFKEILREA